MPKVFKQLDAIRIKLEKHYKDMQDLEFTIEDGKLYMLQTRNGKRTAAAAVKIATDMVKEGLINEKEAVMRVDPAARTTQAELSEIWLLPARSSCPRPMEMS